MFFAKKGKKSEVVIKDWFLQLLKNDLLKFNKKARKKISLLHLHCRTWLASGAGPRIVPYEALSTKNLSFVIQFEQQSKHKCIIALLNLLIKGFRNYLPDNQVDIVLKMEIKLLLQVLNPLKYWKSSANQELKTEISFGSNSKSSMKINYLISIDKTYQKETTYIRDQ